MIPPRRCSCTPSSQLAGTAAMPGTLQLGTCSCFHLPQPLCKLKLSHPQAKGICLWRVGSWRGEAAVILLLPAEKAVCGAQCTPAGRKGTEVLVLHCDCKRSVVHSGSLVSLLCTSHAPNNDNNNHTASCSWCHLSKQLCGKDVCDLYSQEDWLSQHHPPTTENAH